MSMALSQNLDIFELRPLVTNFNCKLSTITDYDLHKQLLCIVSEENDIVLRYTNDTGQEVLKLISWFRRTNRVIHDICFDPTGSWLLVLCFDNTLHIVPALAVMDKSFLEPANSTNPQRPFSTGQITSYIIPFVGPHECPNSKNCPNHSNAVITKDKDKHREPTSEQQNDGEAESNRNKNEAAGNVPDDSLRHENVREDQAIHVDVLPSAELPQIEDFSHDIPLNMLATNVETAIPPIVDKTGNSQMMAASFMASNTCPFPLSVVWWQTNEGINRAIIGYSDGSICFVGLSPNCPFVASTAISDGSVVKLLICKDQTFDSVMLLITSSLKQQYKLLLEQRIIKYIYPGDISPTTAQARENDWQIVMPIKSNIQSDPSSHCSKAEEDVCIKNEETVVTTAGSVTSAPVNTNIAKPTVPPPPPPSTSVTIPSSSNGTNTDTNQMPPPPPYSLAINRQTDSAPVTTNIGNKCILTTSLPVESVTMDSDMGTSTGVRFQQQSLSDYDDNSGKAGILPAARARLASLKSLGSKKINAIRMRLSDNRQKLEEYIPENTHGGFAIVDSPSLTPELLGANNLGSFYTLQNLRSTYLLSALHSQSNSLTVHSIDISLKPLFLYKIPKNCHDILISSNLLYSIQYVDDESPAILAESAEGETQAKQDKSGNTEKENRDNVLEKEEKDTNGNNDDPLDLSHLLDDISGEHSGTTITTTTSGPSTHSSNVGGILVNAVGIMSSAMASLYSCEKDNFNESSLLGLFRFENETVLNLYQMATYRTNEHQETISKEEKTKAFEIKEVRSPMDYVKFYETTSDMKEAYSLRQMEIMQNEFPKINYDPCYVVTDRNVYYIQLKKEPFEIFLDAALASDWQQCREFCTTFDLNYETCIEFAGDYLLRRRKITQALLTYNAARIKPIRTALKLAMFGHTCALMHLSAMALKTTYILNSQFFCHSILKSLLCDITLRHAEDVRSILPPTSSSFKDIVNEGRHCSNYIYGVDESISSLQMSPSSTFHLSNLLLITLAEKAVNDKNYIPLWNFLVTNTKYHTNMTSIVLCQSGLFSSALILAKTRGVCIDTFLALTSVLNQEFGWYSELNVCLYNLSDSIFMETITYLPSVAIEYFNFLQDKLENIRHPALQRIEQQLNPFSAILRPIVSHTSSNHILQQFINDNNISYIFEFCKSLIETYLAVLIHLESHRMKQENIINALSSFRITYEDNQFAIDSRKFKPLSAGCAHCACVVDGVAYFWGSNGVPCNYNVNKSSEPPEPPYAVKSLDLLANLNLDVHTVKCGRQHSLILTNNGLYAFGNNHLSQLGIGKHMLVALQPMLVKTFDTKNITILEAGQYHNAAVADGVLYTWGWGIYGQLGHGGVENVAKPKIVTFFKFKKIIQVSLGHAHSLVLCQEPGNQTTDLYVFGSNHFGQLGIASKKKVNRSDTDEMLCANEVKSLVPIKITVCPAKIRLIHTKFFTNLAIDENERMWIWGSSPQALRLANQIKRRANAKQKLEENQRREISKRFEATFKDCNEQSFSNSTTSNPFPDAEPTAANEEIPSTSRASNAMLDDNELMEEKNLQVHRVKSSRDITKSDYETEEDSSTGIVSEETPEEIERIDEVVDDMVHAVDPMQSVPVIVTTLHKSPKVIEEKQTNSAQSEQNQTQSTLVETESCEHMTPQLVDTSEVAGKILQVSSGLFHFALISSTCTLYTWGKNLEHQLGTEDKERRAVNKPAAIDSIESPMYVDCGADFTLVMSTDYVVRAFGGNSNGQCGRDLGPSIEKMKQRVVCLPTTKRLMRFESQCIDAPVEINLPRPRIQLDNDPVRYLKSIPKYQAHFFQEASIVFNDVHFEQVSPSPSLQQYKSTVQGDSSENAATYQDSDDVVSSLENCSNNDVSSLNLSCNQASLESEKAAEEIAEGISKLALTLENGGCSSSSDLTSVEHSYARLPNTTNTTADKQDVFEACSKNLPQEKTSLSEETKTTLSTDAAEEFQAFSQYIHYCLYIFHGMYNPDKICDCAKERLEYRIRTHMLNFKFVDAFKLCLQECSTPTNALKIFEYFSKDTGFVPLRRQDVKFLIYYLMLHFQEHKFNMVECEQFFLSDLDYYLLELAYVLYFNNNNTALEQSLNDKFKNLIAKTVPAPSNSNGGSGKAFTQQPMQEKNGPFAVGEHKLEDTDVIFDSLSVKFKTIVCQRLIKYCSN